MGEHAVANCALGGMNGADPSVADVAISEMGHIEHRAAPVVARDDDAGASGIDCNHLDGAPVETAGTMVFAGKL